MYPDFNTIKQFNDWGISQDLDWYCEYGFITADQYKQLTGKDYGKSEDTNTSNQSNQSSQQSSQSTQSTAQSDSDKSNSQQNAQSSSNGQSTQQSSGQGQPFTNNQAK